ncbi:hypothetical protein BH23BAC3_BH23BAC3_04910 [soil metagenome]
MRTITFIPFLLLLLFTACGTTEPGVEREDAEPVFQYSDEEEEEYDDEYDASMDLTLSSEERLLLRTRSQLSHHYSEAMEVIPEIYLQEIVIYDGQSDPYAGFRIQLYTTTNVADADSVRDNFVAWADTTIAGYEPDAYVIFRSPNYRVRAGDFQNRERAIAFSNMLKPFYPDAWVVHERIEPSKVPDESADIRFIDIMRIEADDVESPVNDFND